jgi:hypothetical protein
MMNGFVYIVTIALILSWMVGFFILNAGDTVHVLLSIAIGLVAFKMMREERVY